MSISTASFAVPNKTAPKSTAFKTGSIDTSAEQDFLNRTNALRASQGLGSLRTNSELLGKARAWSQTQANSGTIFHSTLTNGVTQNWHRLGENVGMGPTSPAIHDALVRSPRHYGNLVDPGFTEVGIGVIRQGNIIYVTEVLMQYMPASNNQSQAPAPTPAPAPRPTPTPAPTSPAQNTNTPAVASAAQAPIAEAVPLKTASAALNAVIERLSILEA